MADAKTQPTRASVPAFIEALSDPRQQADCHALVQLMTRATGEPPVLWGRNIVGFGRYRYRYASGTSGDWPLAAFAPRGRELTLYFMDGFDTHAAALKKLGPHKHAKACLYVKSLDGLNRAVLASMVAASVRTMRARWPADGADAPRPAARSAGKSVTSTQRAAGGAIPGKATARTASASKTAAKKTAAARTKKAAPTKPATTARSPNAAPAKLARRTPAVSKTPAKTAQPTATQARRADRSHRR